MTFFFLFELGEGRKFIGAEAVYFVKGKRRERTLQQLRSSTFDLDFGIGQFADNAKELFLRGRWPRLVFFTLASTAQAMVTIEVGGGEFDAVLFRHGSGHWKGWAGWFRVLTTFWTACRPLMICSLVIVRFIGALNSISLS